jgi:hypothetical protein
LTVVKDVRDAPDKFACRNSNARSVPMSQTDQTAPQRDSAARVPTMQRILDNPFLLLFLGVTIPTVLYLIWGVMEVASIPLAK